MRRRGGGAPPGPVGSVPTEPGEAASSVQQLLVMLAFIIGADGWPQLELSESKVKKKIFNIKFFKSCSPLCQSR